MLQNCSSKCVYKTFFKVHTTDFQHLDNKKNKPRHINLEYTTFLQISEKKMIYANYFFKKNDNYPIPCKPSPRTQGGFATDAVFVANYDRAIFGATVHWP